MAEVHNHGIDPSCRERLVGECLLKPGIVVVLDPDELTFGAGTVVEFLRSGDGDLLKRLDKTLPAIADQIEAQTKPPRIPEPGLWGVVVADGQGLDDVHWVRQPRGWTAVVYGRHADWEQLFDPALVRPGVDD